MLWQVFSGMWRLGVVTSSQLLGVKPDIAAYAKLLTGGVPAMQDLKPVGKAGLTASPGGWMAFEFVCLTWHSLQGKHGCLGCGCMQLGMGNVIVCVVMLVSGCAALA